MAKPGNNLFFDLGGGFFPVEQHLHTSFTDGKAEPESIVKAAIKKGIERLVFTEHVQRGSAWYGDFILKIEALREKYQKKIDLRPGLEAKLVSLQGEIDATKEQKKKAELIIGSVHGYLKKEKADNNFYDFEDLDHKQALKLELKQTAVMIEACRQNGVRVVGHPLGTFIKHYGQYVPEACWEEIIKQISQRDLVFDLNSRYHRRYFPVLIRLLKKYKTKVNIGSDAHNLAEIGQAYDLLIKYL